MSIARLLEPITPAGGAVTLDEAEGWMQGRTLYGGASALIAYTAAMRAFPGLSPLRAAQIGFVGPLGAAMRIETRMLRKGRNVAQIRVELMNEEACGLSALFVFGSERAANAVHPAAPLTPPPLPPDAAAPVDDDRGPVFIRRNFELRRAQEERGPGAPVVRRWARLRDPARLDTAATLVLMGDVLPPGAIRAMRREGPISSVNWSFNLLDTAPATEDGWWLAETASQHAGEGYSSERLRLWNARGQQVLDGMQCAAIFG